eukprot:TRINITY_DN169_c0_g1_i2.p1 TRINITY_DN169_c0_g1~~TRINITY_DN169_c0_g1_i2.p1  ORF type:complete len:109 (-),score=41.20 TRINITY_DN169_c0_g1_i2:155-481(-)
MPFSLSLSLSNKHAEKLFGYRHQDVRGEGLLNLVHSLADSDTLLPADKDNDIEKMIGDSMEVCGVRSQGGTVRMTMSIQRAASFHAERKISLSLSLSLSLCLSVSLSL